MPPNVPETEQYAISHPKSGRLIQGFARSYALKYVLEQDEVAAEELGLLRLTPGGEYVVVAEGAALVAMAMSERGAPPRHRVMIVSEPMRGRDAESIAVNLLKRVFLQGRLQLISIEVLREVEEGGDDWDNAFTGTLEQSGDLWMQAVERFRAENTVAAEADRLQPTFADLMRDIENEAQAQGPEAVEELEHLRQRYQAAAQELLKGKDLRAQRKAQGAAPGVLPAPTSQIEHALEVQSRTSVAELVTALDAIGGDAALPAIPRLLDNDTANPIKTMVRLLWSLGVYGELHLRARRDDDHRVLTIVNKSSDAATVSIENDPTKTG